MRPKEKTKFIPGLYLHQYQVYTRINTRFIPVSIPGSYLPCTRQKSALDPIAVHPYISTITMNWYEKKEKKKKPNIMTKSGIFKSWY
jgi:hypothetical protein